MGRRAVAIAVAVIISLVIVAAVYLYLLSRPPTSVEGIISGVKKTFTLKSSAFENNGYIPRTYTCDGNDISPPLSWSGAPPETKSYVLIVYDSDAPKGVFYHWLLYNIPADLSALPENVPRGPETPYGLQGVNDFGIVGYGGPCPPTGSTHRYVFLLLALDTRLSLKAGATIDDLLKALDGHVIAYAKLVGIYGR